VALLIVFVAFLIWIGYLYGLDVFGGFFPDGFLAEYWANIQANLGFHIMTFLVGALALALIGELRK
jgi:hypothetical protein